jgi:hypothetical protein
MLDCQATWKLIKQKYVEAPILIFPNWDVEFHVHTGIFISYRCHVSIDLTRKHDQPIIYASILLNNVNINCNT